MTVEARTPQGGEWAFVIDALHALTNTMTVRSHYNEGHPAIARADSLAETTLTKILELVPQVLVAFIDDEFVICERPLPDLRERLHVLASAMTRHEIECIVFRRGMTRAECEILGRTLPLPAAAPGRIRDQAQAKLTHVMLRSLEVRADGAAKKSAGTDSMHLVPAVRTLLADVTLALLADEEIDRVAVRALATRIVNVVSARSFLLEQRAVADGRDEGATHATNVALITAALAIESGRSETVSVDVTAAALLHDVGHVLLPRAIQGVPEPLLDAKGRAVYRTHTTEGALALMSAGCPDLWIAAALEHHRGVDGLGYPTLATKDPPHELVRMIALASFLDKKRTRIDGAAVDPDEALRLALALEDRYFGRPLVSRCVRAIGAYPPGTTVELSNRAPALVTQVNLGDPWRPQVQLLRGPDAGSRVELRELNSLEVRYELSIARPILPPLLVLGDVVVAAEDAPQAEGAAAEGGEAAVARTPAPPARTPAPPARTPGSSPAPARVRGLEAIVADVLEPSAAELAEEAAKAAEAKAAEAKAAEAKAAEAKAAEAKAAEAKAAEAKAAEAKTTEAARAAEAAKAEAARAEAAKAEAARAARAEATKAASPAPARASSSKPPAADDDLQAQLLAFLSDPPPAAAPTKAPLRASSASGMSAPVAPPVITAVSRPPARAGAYSSGPPSPDDGASNPLHSAAAYSNAPPQIVSSVSKPVSSAGAYSARPPAISEIAGKAPTSSSPPPPTKASPPPPHPEQPTQSTSRRPTLSESAPPSSRRPTLTESSPPSSRRPTLTESSPSQSTSRRPTLSEQSPPASSRTPGPTVSKRPTKPPTVLVPVLVASAAVIARQEGLDHRAGFILSMIDGAASLDDITDASGMSAADVERLVDTLVERGLVGLKSV